MLSKSIIEDLFYAERHYLENIPRGEEHDILLSSLADLDRDMCDKLKSDPPLFDLYHKIDNVHNEFYCYAEKNNFVYGFKFGFKLAMDILS